MTHYTEASTCKEQGYEYDECSYCNNIFNRVDLPIADHSWNDWTVVKESTTEAEGEEQRNCVVCGDIETRAIPKLNKIKDENTGVEIIYKDEYDSNVEIKVEPVFDGDSYQIIEMNFGNTNSKIFDISTVKDGEKVQPNGKVTVRIPVPADFTGTTVFVCFVDSSNGTVENIPAVVKNGYIEFEATHFSYYAIIEIIGKVNSVSIEDISMNYKNSTTIVPTVDVAPGVEYTVVYSSSNPSVASVDKNGNVSTGKTGSATITVTVTDEYGNTVTDTCEVKVSYSWWQWIIFIVLFGWIWY